MDGNGQLKNETESSKLNPSRRSSRAKKESTDAKYKKRNLHTEVGGVATAPCGAMSSFKALFFHDIPPEVLFALANRYTGGHKKYGVGHVNLNWKSGLNDPEYIADRYNHAVTHLISITDEELEEKDEHLEGAIWNVAFLLVAKKRCPEAYKKAFVQGGLFGEAAKELQEKMKNELSRA